jgi:uncharacterized membrane protein
MPDFKATAKATAAQLAQAIPSRLHRRIFLASLALNLLTAGFLLGDVLGGHGDRPPRVVDIAFGSVTHALSDDDREAIMQGLSEQPALRALGRNRMQAEATALATALCADPYDPAAVEVVFDQQITAVMAAQSTLKDALLARMQTMSADARAELADDLQDD